MATNSLTLEKLLEVQKLLDEQTVPGPRMLMLAPAQRSLMQTVALRTDLREELAMEFPSVRPTWAEIKTDPIFNTPEWTALAKKVIDEASNHMIDAMHYALVQAPAGKSRPTLPQTKRTEMAQARRTVSRVLMFDALARHLSPECQGEIKELHVMEDSQTMDILVAVDRKRDLGRALLRFPRSHVQEWQSETKIVIDSETLARLILFLQA